MTGKRPQRQAGSVAGSKAGETPLAPLMPRPAGLAATGERTSAFAFSDRQRAEILRIAPELAAVIVRIEAVCDMHHPAGSWSRDLATIKAGLQRQDDARAKSMATIANLASDLAASVSALSTANARALGINLARWQDPATVASLDAMTTIEHRAWLAAHAAGALAVHTDAIRAIKEAAQEVSDARAAPHAIGRPVARGELITALHGIIDMLDDGSRPDWERDWHPYTAPSGRFCRLLALCLEALGEPVHSNIALLVRRSLARDEGAWQASRAPS
jgi:hypothetical protein